MSDIEDTPVRQNTDLRHRVMTEDEYAYSHIEALDMCALTTPNAHMSKSSQKAQIKMGRDNVMRRRDQLAEARKEYQKLVEAGELRPPTRLEHLLKGANSHPDHESTHACRRLLAKQGIDWRTGERSVEEARP